MLSSMVRLLRRIWSAVTFAGSTLPRMLVATALAPPARPTSMSLAIHRLFGSVMLLWLKSAVRAKQMLAGYSSSIFHSVQSTPLSYRFLAWAQVALSGKKCTCAFSARIGRAAELARPTHHDSIMATSCSRSCSSMMVNGSSPALSMIRSILCASGRYSSNIGHPFATE